MTRPLYRRPRAIGMLASLSILAGLGAVSAMAQDLKTPDYDAIVASPDRSDGDRQADQRRQPARMRAFAAVKAGRKVLDMEANDGYSTERLARTAAPPVGGECQ